MRQGLRSLLDEHGDLVVVGEAADGRTALQLLTEIDVDVVVMDVNLPGMDGRRGDAGDKTRVTTYRYHWIINA